MTDKIGNGSMPLRIGNLINTTVYGGPYRDVPVDFFGVKMAEEIKHPHMVSVPTKDFCVPEVNVLKAGIVRALMGMMNEEIVYVGCMGGIGRTGLFLAALAKVQIEYRKAKHRPGRGEDPVLYVRRHFIPNALETQQQKDFIADFDVSGIVDWLDVTQTVLGLGGLTPVRTVEVTAIGDTERHFVPVTHCATNWIPDELDNPLPTWEQFDSLQSQIDELQEQVNTVERGTSRVGAAVRILQMGKETDEGLTKQSIFSKIRRMFS